ncbi:MAG: HIT domain-containing protein [Chloroflexota bacterium]
MAPFEIHQQLRLDSHYLGKFSLCHVLLHRNGALPWFILVPETDTVDFLDLPDGARHAAMQEAASVSAFIKNVLGYPKVNFAAIGNVVPQLHLHIVGRRPNDPCWPAPVWGHLIAARGYSAAEINAMREALARHSAIRFTVAV